MDNTRDPLPYYKLGGSFRPLWQLREGGLGCMPVWIEDVCLKQDRPPPKLIHAPPPPSAPPVKTTPRVQTDGMVKMVTDILDFIDWVRTRPPPPVPKVQAAPKPPAPPAPTVPPFDIQDIPRAMDALGLKISAKLMRRWFAGQLNYSRTKHDESHGINQFGQPYPKSMVDTESVKMEWLLQYRFIKEQYTELSGSAVYSPGAMQELKGKPGKGPGLLQRFFDQTGMKSGWLHTRALCGDDIEQLHARFQFQLSKVHVWRSVFARDISAALGNFYFYAAVGVARVESQIYRRRENLDLRYYIRRTVHITHIYVYAKDNYSFTDGGDGYSQYLGHWNRYDMLWLAASLAGDYVEKEFGPQPQIRPHQWDGTDNPVYTEKPLSERSVYYPIRNRDFRAWQQKHQQGGDFLIYSDKKFIRLEKPIIVELPECPI
ncbi:DUF6402 family protein [Trinickia sp. YCB016]